MRSDAQIYCSICGAPILGGGHIGEKSEEWLNDAMLLSTARKTQHGTEIDTYFPPWPPRFGPYAFDLGPDQPDESQRSVLRLSARSKDGTNSFSLLESGEHVFASQLVFDWQKPGPPPHGVPLYLAVHRLCLQLADRFIESTKASLILAEVPNDGITSILNLWRVLHRRLPGGTAGTSTLELPEPHDYFGGKRARNIAWEARDDPEHSEIFEQNPVNIPNLTSILLQNLASAPSPTPVPFHSTNVASNPKQNMDNQSWHLSALLNTHLLPWLFDLDVTQILQKDTLGSWDWYGLVKRLMVPSIHEPGDISLSLPLGLKNRRRIWRLLEEARVNDVAGRQEAERAARKKGEERMTAINQSSQWISNTNNMPDWMKEFPPPRAPLPPSEKDG